MCSSRSDYMVSFFLVEALVMFLDKSSFFLNYLCLKEKLYLKLTKTSLKLKINLKLTLKLYLTWNPPLRKMGGQLYWALGYVSFSGTPGGFLAKWGFKMFYTFLWGTAGFPLLEDGRSPSLTDQKFTHPSPTRRCTSRRLPPPNFYYPRQRFIPSH